MANIGKIIGHLQKIETLSPAGFAIAFHIRLSAPEFLFQTYPKDWINLYSKKGYVIHDPIVRWGFANSGCIRWTHLTDLDDQDVLKQSVAYGMVYGCAIATETGTSRSVAGFARSDREFTDAEIATLQAHTQDLHDLTATKTGMPKAVHDELHRLSVKMTHPSAQKV